MPKDMTLEDVKDHYFWYVIQAGISENLFWNGDISFINGVLSDKSAYDKWLSYQTERRQK